MKKALQQTRQCRRHGNEQKITDTVNLMNDFKYISLSNINKHQFTMTFHYKQLKMNNFR